MVTLTLKGLSKSGKYALYSGLATIIRISTTTFKDKTPPQTFTADSDVFAGPREARVKVQETKEERKARLAALPKLTAAERVARMETKLAKAKAKLAAAQAAPAAQPEGETVSA